MSKRDQEVQPKVPAMTISNRPYVHDHLRLAVGWWVVATWGLFLATFPTTLAFSIDANKIAFLACGVAGVVGGVLAVRRRRTWLPLIAFAFVLLSLLYALYWIPVVDQILQGETEKTLTQAALRIWQMTSISIEAGGRFGGVWGRIASVYRELLMPVIQLAAVALFVAWQIRNRSKSP